MSKKKKASQQALAKIPLTNTTIREAIQEVKLGESYISLLVGVVVVIVVAVVLIGYIQTRRKLQKMTQDISSQKTHIASDRIKLPTIYIVKDGDDLGTISQKFYSTGDKYPEIAEANNIEDIDNINPGTKLIIPKIDGAKVLGVEDQKAILGDKYTIVDGDLLWDIAVRSYGDGYRWIDIAKANNIETPDAITAGQILTIPR